MRKIKIDEYEIVEDLNNGVFKVLRNGEEWQDLIGNNFVLSLVDELEKLSMARESTIRSLIISVNKDIAEGTDESIWGMTIEEYLLRPSKNLN